MTSMISYMSTTSYTYMMTKKVIQWFIDALLVNVGATAFRPDKTKVSNPQTLQNISVALLKLCEPFMNDSSRIHPGYVSSPSHHKGVFVETGDDAVLRLAENPDCPTEPYAPKNTFIPQIFFPYYLGIFKFVRNF